MSGKSARTAVRCFKLTFGAKPLNMLQEIAEGACRVCDYPKDLGIDRGETYFFSDHQKSYMYTYKILWGIDS